MSLPLIITINIDPVLVHLGPVAIRWYGLMYAVGLALGLRVTLPIAERKGISRDAAYSLFWIVTVAALLGGRLYFVVQNNAAAYLAHPTRILAFWEGGMAFYGAIFLGVPALFIATRMSKKPFLLILDIAALFAPLAQAVGRIGNIINGDILGYPSTLPWATAYMNPHSFARPLCEVRTTCIAFQPAALYEMLFSLALFAVLWRLQERFRAGMLFLLYLALYSIGQLVLFVWRDNILVLGPLKQAQVTALVVLAFLLPIALFLNSRAMTPQPVQETGEQASTLPIEDS